MKSITVKELMNKFSLEVLAGEDQLDRKITKSKAHRPGLEFVGFFEFFRWSLFRCWGEKS